MGSPFSPEAVQRIMDRLTETSVAGSDGDVSVEFKLSFNKSGIPEYGRTLAGFANALGWAPKMRQAVKTQPSSNGELSHGIIT